MKIGYTIFVLFLGAIASPAAVGSTASPDPDRDILVTFDNRDAAAGGAGVGAPYRNRKRYAITATARRHARAVAKEYSLAQVDHWPIKSLSVYCFVYRVAEKEDREGVIARLRADDRVESAQPLQSFETSAATEVHYDDTYANLQHGLDMLDVTRAHRYSTGAGVRVAIVDSAADLNHEDLQGRVRRLVTLIGSEHRRDADHGTAVASVIGATANNATGIVGIAPESQLEVFVACWRATSDDKAICDSFTLAKAIDALLEEPPDILNLSLTGPEDPLLARLLQRVINAGVVVVAAKSGQRESKSQFPASHNGVIGVASSRHPAVGITDAVNTLSQIFAPGDRILVALPGDVYDMRSGSSLAAAHVSGVVALLLAISPDLDATTVAELLLRSQSSEQTAQRAVNACRVLHLADARHDCNDAGGEFAHQKTKRTVSATRASARSAELTIGTHRFVSW